MTTEIDIELDKDFVDTVVEEIIPEECEASECASYVDNRLGHFTDRTGKIQLYRRNSRDCLVLGKAEARELFIWLAKSSGIWKV